MLIALTSTPMLVASCAVAEPASKLNATSPPLTPRNIILPVLIIILLFRLQPLFPELGARFKAGEVHRNVKAHHDVRRVFGQTKAEAKVYYPVRCGTQTQRHIDDTGGGIRTGDSWSHSVALIILLWLELKVGLEVVGLLVAGTQRHFITERISHTKGEADAVASIYPSQSAAAAILTDATDIKGMGVAHRAKQHHRVNHFTHADAAAEGVITLAAGHLSTGINLIRAIASGSRQSSKQGGVSRTLFNREWLITQANRNITQRSVRDIFAGVVSV